MHKFTISLKNIPFQITKKKKKNLKLSHKRWNKTIKGKKINKPDRTRGRGEGETPRTKHQAVENGDRLTASGGGWRLWLQEIDFILRGLSGTPKEFLARHLVT